MFMMGVRRANVTTPRKVITVTMKSNEALVEAVLANEDRSERVKARIHEVGSERRRGFTQPGDHE